MYTQEDELTLLRDGLDKLYSKVRSLRCTILTAQSKRTYSNVKEVLEEAYNEVVCISKITSYYNKPNLYNVKNKEEQIAKYNQTRREREIQEEENYLDFIKQLDEVYPT